MEVVKMPKKLRDAFDLIRKGRIEDGLAVFPSVGNFEAKKYLALAEIAYFKEEHLTALEYDEKALPIQDWYADNVLTEHLCAYAYSAFQAGEQKRALAFAELNIGGKSKKILSNYLKELQITKTFNLYDPLTIIETGKPFDEFIAQLKKYRPKLTFDSSAGADYLLNYMFKESESTAVLDYYEKYAIKLSNTDHHISAAVMHALLNKIPDAQNSIRLFVRHWFPVDDVQALPMRLFEYPQLYPALTKELKLEILTSEKMIDVGKDQ